MLIFSPKNARNLTKKYRKNYRKKYPKSVRLEVRNDENDGKTSTFLLQASRTLPDKFSDNLRKFCQKTGGKPSKPHRKCSKTVRKFAENSAGNQAKLRQKSAQISGEKTTKPCQQFPIMVPDVHRQAAISQGGALIRVAPLPSPILSPIFLNYYFASIFRDVILKIPSSEQTSPHPLLTAF